MGYEVDGVEVGGPRPSWADGENRVLPQDVKTVIYPEDIRVTDGQLESDRNLDTHPKAGEFDSRADEAAAEAESTADNAPSAEDSTPPGESTVDSVE